MRHAERSPQSGDCGRRRSLGQDDRLSEGPKSSFISSSYTIASAPASLITRTGDRASLYRRMTNEDGTAKHAL